MAHGIAAQGLISTVGVERAALQGRAADDTDVVDPDALSLVGLLVDRVELKGQLDGLALPVAQLKSHEGPLRQEPQSS